MYAHITEPPPVVTAARPDVPAALDAVVAKAMAKEPDDRYQSAGELATRPRRARTPIGCSAARLAAVDLPPVRRPQSRSRAQRPNAADAVQLVRAALRPPHGARRGRRRGGHARLRDSAARRRPRRRLAGSRRVAVAAPRGASRRRAACRSCWSREPRRRGPRRPRRATGGTRPATTARRRRTARPRHRDRRPAAAAAVATIKVGKGPDGVAVSGGQVFVANQRAPARFA